MLGLTKSQCLKLFGLQVFAVVDPSVLSDRGVLAQDHIMPKITMLADAKE